MRFKQTYYKDIQVISEDMELLFENLPIKNFNKLIPSHINKKYFKQRKDSGDVGSFLKKVDWNNKLGTLKLTYSVVATPTLPIKNIAKTGRITGAKKYKTEVQFGDVEQYLGKRKDFLKLSKGEQIKKMRMLSKNGSIKLHSNDMSWIYQGVWRRAQDNDYNIYPLPKNRMDDTGYWKGKHGKEIYATKHIMEVIGTIPFTVDTISQMIRKKYK